MKKVILSCLKLTLCVCVRLVFDVRKVGVLDWCKRGFFCVRVGEKILKGGGIEMTRRYKIFKKGEQAGSRGGCLKKGGAGTPYKLCLKQFTPTPCKLCLEKFIPSFNLSLKTEILSSSPPPIFFFGNYNKDTCDTQLFSLWLLHFKKRCLEKTNNLVWEVKSANLRIMPKTLHQDWTLEKTIWKHTVDLQLSW